jgi:hypothetical protein
MRTTRTNELLRIEVGPNEADRVLTQPKFSPLGSDLLLALLIDSNPLARDLGDRGQESVDGS